MALPTQKHTKSRQRKRRTTHKLTKVVLTTCPKCKKAIKPHTACPFCGNYKDRETIKIKLPKALRKKKIQQEKKEAKKEEKKKDKETKK